MKASEARWNIMDAIRLNEKEGWKKKSVSKITWMQDDLRELRVNKRGIKKKKPNGQKNTFVHTSKRQDVGYIYSCIFHSLE